ncbi:alpha/beta hydrolase [Rhizobium deserti]|uniref:Alpha/beta hydrolase n=1 Tax=Rhizobium deserti TaxID=2547961 RepID=A0A4R5UIN6_9HYPH|nr:alpha/beta hydrolase [Rhizobium deserti]TDK36614.1 alpha/beta hydrolase [Rhizobium deserti]
MSNSILRHIQFLFLVFAVMGSVISISRSGELADGELRIDIGGFELNSLLVPAQKGADLPPIVFLHGASANLYDPVLSFRAKLEGRATMLFVDRPGHGRSDAGGSEDIYPDGQADSIARLMEKRGIPKAIIVGHSFGGAIAAAIALRHPDKVIGLVFLSPAVYPWPGGVAWYYDAARRPVSGTLFSAILAPSIGLFAMNRAIAGVFAPNRPPPGYSSKTKAWQALRPAAFRHNAQEIAGLSKWAETASRHYGRIKAPTVIITGDADQIVSPQLHARQLTRAIRGSQLVVVHNLGHKSDYVAADLAIAAIEKVAGRDRDLHAKAVQLERQIANDR